MSILKLSPFPPIMDQKLSSLLLNWTYVLAKTDWNGMLHFAGSESDLRSPGVMEGAVGAAWRVLDELQEFLTER